MKHSLVACLLSLAVCLGHSRAASNIDVLEPIVRVSPARDQGSNDDYFGYAVVLHQLELPNRGDFQGSLDATRIIVGAPAGTYPGGLDLPDAPNATNMTGLVYLCPVNPGDCEGLRSNETGNDRRMFDDEANENREQESEQESEQKSEQKSGQFMGATLQSTGLYFMACAPRYVTFRSLTLQPVDGRRPQGRCFFSPRNLTGFTGLRPCDGASDDAYHQENRAYCMAGTGATIYNNGSDSLLVLGAPGEQRSRGALYFYSSESPGTSPVTSGPADHQVYQNVTPNLRTVDDLYQGFTLTTGNIRRKDEADVITSLPRFNGVAYTGGVRFFDVNDINNPSEIFPNGTQPGEYFGWALATADLNGDGFDELIVGAPMYSSIFNPEIGRVYVFENMEGTLTDVGIPLTQDVAYSRFGSSIVNIGDANNDGYEDIAIGAPYMDLGSDLANGTVFVYYGNPDTVIEDTPGQTISARSVVDSVDGLDELTTFGYSLASGVDVDANEYDDLVVGSYANQVVVLFRTLSIADIEVNTTNVGLVNINNANCPLSNGSLYACFNVTICASYTGRGLQNRTLETTLQIKERTSVAETNEQRLFFDSAPFTNTLDVLFTFPQDGVQICQDIITYVLPRDSIGDIFSTLVLDILFLQLPRDPITVTGNQRVADLRETPLLRISGELEINATVDAECGEICYSDLVLEVDQVTYGTAMGEVDRLLVDATNTMDVTVTYYNDMSAEDAILAQLHFCLPPLLRHSRVDALTDSNQAFDCSPGNQGDNDTICDLNEMPEGTPYTCDLEQLLRANGDETTLLLRWVVQATETLRGDEPDFEVPIAIGIPSPDEGRNRENETDRGNNERTIVIDVAAVVDVEISSVTFSTTDITYSGANPLESGATNISANDLGSRFELNTEVVNNGPSSTPEAILTIYLPINSSDTGKFYYLYPAEWTFSVREGGMGSVNCRGSPYINPDGLVVQSNTNRKRRSVLNPYVREHRRRVRMAERGRRQTPQAQTSDNTMCSSSNVDSCVPIQCTLSGLTSTSTVVVTIIGYIDERFFQGRDQTFAFQAYANVTVSENLDYIEEPVATNNGRQSNELLVRRRPGRDDDEFPWWIAFVCVLGALILIVILFIILYFVGFFRRKRPEKEGEAEGDFEPPVQGVAIKELPSDEKTEEIPSDQKPEKPDLADEGDGTYETEI